MNRTIDPSVRGVNTGPSVVNLTIRPNVGGGEHLKTRCRGVNLTIGPNIEIQNPWPIVVNLTIGPNVVEGGREF